MFTGIKNRVRTLLEMAPDDVLTLILIGYLFLIALVMAFAPKWFKVIIVLWLIF